MITPAIEVKNFTFAYPGGNPVLENFDLVVNESQNTALLGRNGAGKSTLLRALVGLLHGRGSIRIFGQDLNRRTILKIRRQVGFLFQDPQVQLFCPTVLEDVAFGPLNLHDSKDLARRQALAALERVGFTRDPHTPCHKLSLGELRKAALAGVLVCEPRILLLDEPDSYLDQDGREKISAVLRGLKDVTLLIASHNRDFVDRLCIQTIDLSI